MFMWTEYGGLDQIQLPRDHKTRTEHFWTELSADKTMAENFWTELSKHKTRAEYLLTLQTIRMS